jgi:hypothetical protein
MKLNDRTEWVSIPLPLAEVTLFPAGLSVSSTISALLVKVRKQFELEPNRHWRFLPNRPIERQGSNAAFARRRRRKVAARGVLQLCGARLGGGQDGKWKPSLPPNQEPKLYDLDEDIREAQDVSDSFLAAMKEMLALAAQGGRIAER